MIGAAALPLESVMVFVTPSTLMVISGRNVAEICREAPAA